MNNENYNLKIILLAAGKSERFKDIKLLAKVEPKDSSVTLIEQVLQQISVCLKGLNIAVNKLQVATGIYHAEIEKRIGNNFLLSFCQHAHHGLGHTIAQSVENIVSNDSKTSHIMITLADQIALDIDDYTRLIKQSQATPNKLICAKAAQEIMPPAIFPSRYFTQLMNLTGDKGAKALLHQNKENLHEVIMENALIDIDTQQDLTRWFKKTH